jgi:hypothetical protein
MLFRSAIREVVLVPNRKWGGEGLLLVIFKSLVYVLTFFPVGVA